MRSPSIRWISAVLAVSFPAALAAQSTQFSASQALAGDAAIAPATGDQTATAIAAGGSEYLVAWVDSRAKLSTHYSQTGLGQTARDIWVQRLDAQGVPLEALPIALDLAPGEDTDPEIAWNGENWLVTWISQAPQGSIYSSAIVGMRVSPSGVRLDAEPIVVLNPGGGSVYSHALASDGQNWVIVAQAGSSMLAVRIAPSGAVFDPTPVPVLPSSQLLNSIDLAYAGGVFLLVWSDTYTATGWDVLGLRFNSGLQVQGAGQFAIAATSFNDIGADVDSNGAQFAVGFERYVTSTGQADVQLARVTPAGAVLDPTPIALTPNLPYGNGLSTSVAWDGTQWFASWNYGGVYLARIAASGAVLDFGGFPLAPGAAFNSRTGACLASVGLGGAQVTWVDTRAGSYEGADVYAAQVDGPGAIGAEAALSTGASAQLDVDLATDGTMYVAVYCSEASGTRRILAERLDASGAPLDAEPIEIASGLFEYTPSVAYTNGVWLVTWSRSFDPLQGVAIYARRMASDGTLLDPAPILVGNGYTPEVAGLGADFMVVWTRPTSTYPLLSFPYAVRVRAADGAVLGSPVVINSTYALVPDVCALGDRWVVVWQRNWSSTDPWADVGGAFLAADGSLQSTFFVGGVTTYNYLPKIAASADQALIVWQSGPGYGYARRVFARRLGADGTFLDTTGFQVATNTNPQQVRPSVAWDGLQYLVAFEDTRAASVTLDQRTDIYAVRVTSGGTVLDPVGIPVETAAVPEHSVAVIGSGGGEGLLAASILQTDASHASYRIGVRTFDSAPVVEHYCTAGTSASGCLAVLSAAGQASASASSGFVVSASGVEASKDGLFLYAQNGRQANPWGNGTSFQCVVPPVKRGGLLAGSGANGSCAGSFSQDLNARWCSTCPKPNHAPQAGVPLQVQLWYRDPQGTSNQPTSFSNALEVEVIP